MSCNFALILFVLLVATGIVWCYDLFAGRRIRLTQAQSAGVKFDVQHGSNNSLNASAVAQKRQELVMRTGQAPCWIEYAVSLFPVILFVFVLRSFIVEPFRIPSGSMLPTLQSGDLILVNKFSYGLRLPILSKKVINLGKPQRGDVLVFRYPVEPEVDYIKRVVGLPGDEISYIDKKLYVNGAEVKRARDGDYYEPDRVAYISKFNESLGSVSHKILVDLHRTQHYSPIWNFPDLKNCNYARNGIRCTVPTGQYFAMGDNRDNSADSRYWGFIPDHNIVGKAFFIWMNFSDPGRIGRFD